MGRLCEGYTVWSLVGTTLVRWVGGGHREGRRAPPAFGAAVVVECAVEVWLEVLVTSGVRGIATGIHSGVGVRLCVVW